MNETLSDKIWITPHCDFCMNQKIVIYANDVREAVKKLLKELDEPIIKGLNNFNNQNGKELPYSTLTAMVSWIVKETKIELNSKFGKELCE